MGPPTYRTWETERPWIIAEGSSETTDPQDGAKYTIKFERFVMALKLENIDFYNYNEIVHFYYK